MASYQLVDSYAKFQAQQGKESTDTPMYLGEYLARTHQAELTEGRDNYLIWRTDAGLEICQVEQRNARLSIKSVGRIVTRAFDTTWQDLLSRSDVSQWLDCCFVQGEQGGIVYDPYYDTLPLADDCPKNIGQLNADLSQMAQLVEGPRPKENVWLVGELATQRPLVNALTQTYGLKAVHQMPQPATERVEVDHPSQQVAGPSRLVIHTMNTGKDEATLHAQEWLVPIGQAIRVIASCDDETATVRFGDQNIDLMETFGNLEPDYTAYGEGWQIITMRVEADLLGNQRLTIETNDGQCKDFVDQAPHLAHFDLNEPTESDKHFTETEQQ